MLRSRRRNVIADLDGIRLLGGRLQEGDVYYSTACAAHPSASSRPPGGAVSGVLGLGEGS